jgi:hypothetical protein
MSVLARVVTQHASRPEKFQSIQKINRRLYTLSGCGPTTRQEHFSATESTESTEKYMALVSVASVFSLANFQASGSPARLAGQARSGHAARKLYEL